MAVASLIAGLFLLSAASAEGFGTFYVKSTWRSNQDVLVWQHNERPGALIETGPDCPVLHVLDGTDLEVSIRDDEDGQAWLDISAYTSCMIYDVEPVEVFRHEYGYGFLLDEAIERRFQRQHPHFVELTSALGFASPNRAARYLKSHPDLENWIWARAEHEMPDGDIVPFTIGWFDWRRPSAARVLSCGYLRAGDERERCLYRLYLREKPPYVSGANRIGRLQTNTVILSSYWLTAWYERNTRSRSTWEAFATYGSRNAVEHVVLGGGYRYYLLGHFGLGVFAEVLGGARYHRFYNTDYGNAFFGPAVGAKGALPVGLTAQVRVGATYAVGYKSEGGTTIADVGLGWSF